MFMLFVSHQNLFNKIEQKKNSVHAALRSQKDVMRVKREQCVCGGKRKSANSTATPVHSSTRAHEYTHTHKEDGREGERSGKTTNKQCIQ